MENLQSEINSAGRTSFVFALGKLTDSAYVTATEAYDNYYNSDNDAVLNARYIADYANYVAAYSKYEKYLKLLEAKTEGNDNA